MKVALLGPIAKDTIIIDGAPSIHMGGIPYYEAHVLHNLDVETEVFITYAKNDEQWVLENFQGIKVNPIYVEQTLETTIVRSNSTPNKKEITETVYDPSSIIPEETLVSRLNNFDYIIFGPLYYSNISFELFEKLKNKNLILGNFGLFTYYENKKMVWRNPENLAKISGFLQYLFLDENEIKYAAQKDTAEESARYFLSLGVKNVVVTFGSDGSVIYAGKEVYQIPAFPVDGVVDPTGAGDTYLAAYIASIPMFENIKQRGRFASVAAATVVEKHGAFNGNLKEVLEKLKKVAIY